jgi:hypothetical protein
VKGGAEDTYIEGRDRDSVGKAERSAGTDRVVKGGVTEGSVVRDREECMEPQGV